MSQHSGHTDSDGMISDMAEGSGANSWRSEFPDDSDFGADGSGSGDGYSGEGTKRGLLLLIGFWWLKSHFNLNAISCTNKSICFFFLYIIYSSGLSKVPIPERPTYQPPVVIHNPRNENSAAPAAVKPLHVAMFVAINILSLLLLRSH